MKKWKNIGGKLPPLLFITGLLITWELLGRFFAIPAYILPMPTAIIKALSHNWSLLLVHSRTTLLAAVAGLALAIVVGILIAVLMNKLPVVKRTFYPLLVISQTIPIIALAPVLMIWFGFGVNPKILVVSLVCFFPVVVSMVEGLENVDPEMIELMNIMEAGPWLIFREVQFPAVLSHLFSGLKIATTYSIMAAVIAEWLGAGAGLGVYMTRAMHSFNAPNLYAAILLVVLLSLLLFQLVVLTERLFTPWKAEKGWLL